MQMTHTKLVTLKLSPTWIKMLDDTVKAGIHPNRSAAIRAAIRDMLKDMGFWGWRRT